MDDKKYFKHVEQSFGRTAIHPSIQFSLRAELAWDLIHHFGLIAGDISHREDSKGRAKGRLQTPQEVVDRCYDIADTFIARAEGMGDIQEISAPAISRSQA